MFCPNCKAEFRQGFTRCSDCDADLVHELSANVGEDSTNQGTGFIDAHDSDLRPIWKGNDQAVCVALCGELLKEDIPYKVAQNAASRDASMRVKFEFEIGVQSSDHDRAKKLLGIDGDLLDERHNPDDDHQEEVADDEYSFPPDDLPPDAEIRNDAYLKPWYPEDATIEVWTQNGDDLSNGIQMALKENLIHSRLELRDGPRKVFVLPEDEARARKIVHEIMEGITPL